MALKNFNFPRVTLTQEFTGANVGNQTVLSVACIGRPYYLHRADVESEAATAVDIAYSGSSTSAAALPGLVTEVPIDGGTAYVAAVEGTTTFQKIFVDDGDFEHVTVSGSTYATGLSSTTESVELNCGIYVKSGNGQVAAADFGTREAEIGDKVAISGSSVSGTGTITNITRSTTAGGYDSIVVDLSGATITGSAGTITSIIFLVQEDAELLNTDGTASGVSINAANKTYQILANVKGYIGGKLNKLHTGTYDFKIQYRQVNKLFRGRLGSVYNADAVDEILGGACLDNPLALAVKLAALAAPDTIVYFTTPNADTDTPVSFKDALDFLDKYDEVYSIVPLTDDPTTIATLLNEVIAKDQDEDSKVRRSLWYGLDVTYTESTNWGKVNEIVTAKKAIPSSYKQQAVWVDGFSYGGQDNLPNWCGAAAAAGMRSYEPCQRPLSNLGYDFFTVKEPNGFTLSQLKAIASEGIWIIANNADDVPINMRQLTTAAANDLNQDEESIVANVDDIALTLCRVGEERVGCSNITPIMVMALSDDITLKMDQKLINTTGSEYIGPQLISWSLDKIYQDTVHKDRVYAVISCEPPKPFNEFKMTLRII